MKNINIDQLENMDDREREALLQYLIKDSNLDAVYSVVDIVLSNPGFFGLDVLLAAGKKYGFFPEPLVLWKEIMTTLGKELGESPRSIWMTFLQQLFAYTRYREIEVGISIHHDVVNVIHKNINKVVTDLELNFPGSVEKALTNHKDWMDYQQVDDWEGIIYSGRDYYYEEKEEMVKVDTPEHDIGNVENSEWDWPIIDPLPAMPDGSTLDNSDFRNRSALAAFGYAVGKTRGWEPAKRHRFLNDFMRRQLPPGIEDEFGNEYGSPLTTTRLRKVAFHIASICGLAIRRDEHQMRFAIADWETDLEFLKTTFYEGEGLKFTPWPDPRDMEY